MTETFWGILIPFLGTSLGAACVFFMRRALGDKCGFKDKGYICYEEDAQESVVLRELLDKKLWNIPDRIKDKGQFEEKLNQSIRQYNPEYWRARQSGREAAEAARSTAPAKEAAR